MIKSKHILLVLTTPLCFIGLWSLIAPAYNLPTILEIVNAFGTMIDNGTFFHDILISSIRALSGFFIGLFL